MKRIFVSLIVVLCVLGQGCVALHYKNSKGIDGKAKDAQVKAVKIEKGKADFTSTVDLWIFFPWKFKVKEKTTIDYWE